MNIKKFVINKTIELFKRFIKINIKFIKKELENYDKELLKKTNEKLLKKLQFCGENVMINGQIYISDLQSVIIGNNVHIGNNAYISSAGGLIIGDNTHISRNVTIYTVNHNYQGKLLPYDRLQIPKSVFIGKNVWIGMNVSIIPGIRIGDGAIIGMGTVVTKDVPPMGIIGNSPNRLIKSRDILHYHDLDSSRSYGGVNGSKLKIETINIIGNKQCVIEKEKVFFVLSTGRSGTKSVAEMLSNHPDVICLHEPRRQLIRLSSELAHGTEDYHDILQEIQDIFTYSYVDKNIVYGESDQKYFNLVPIINELLPGCKFIWLIRNGKDFVASAYARGWYSTEQTINMNPGGRIMERYYFYRLNGDKCSDYNLLKPWKSLSPFEKNCWYWNYVNASIEKDLLKLSNEIWIKIKIEDIETRLNDLQNFLDIQEINLNLIRSNQADYDTYNYDEWSIEEKRSFNSICGKNFSRWYEKL
jgi:acetyltransferase-like isoleucine patch superfamily enzyme